MIYFASVCVAVCCSVFERVFASTMIYGEGAWMRVATCYSVSPCVLGSIAIYFASVLVAVCCSVFASIMIYGEGAWVRVAVWCKCVKVCDWLNHHLYEGQIHDLFRG